MIWDDMTYNWHELFVEWFFTICFPNNFSFNRKKYSEWKLMRHRRNNHLQMHLHVMCRIRLRTHLRRNKNCPCWSDMHTLQSCCIYRPAICHHSEVLISNMPSALGRRTASFLARFDGRRAKLPIDGRHFYLWARKTTSGDDMIWYDMTWLTMFDMPWESRKADSTRFIIHLRNVKHLSVYRKVRTHIFRVSGPMWAQKMQFSEAYRWAVWREGSI